MAYSNEDIDAAIGRGDKQTVWHCLGLYQRRLTEAEEDRKSLAEERAEFAKRALKAEERERVLLEKFRHTHGASDSGDACKYCGFDLRHPIHNRLSTEHDEQEKNEHE